MKKRRFTERDYYARCQTCGASFDMRDLAQVKKHLHGKTYKAARGRRPRFRNTPRRNDPGALRATDVALCAGGETPAGKLRATGLDDVTRLFAAFASVHTVIRSHLVRYVFCRPGTDDLPWSLRSIYVIQGVIAFATLPFSPNRRPSAIS